MSEQRVSTSFKLKAKLNYYLARIFTFHVGLTFTFFDFDNIFNELNKIVNYFRSLFKKVVDFLGRYYDDTVFPAYVLFFIGFGFISFFILTFINPGNILYDVFPRFPTSTILIILVAFPVGFLGACLGVVFALIGFPLCLMGILGVFYFLSYILQVFFYLIAGIFFLIGNIVYNIVYNLFMVLKAIGLYLFNLFSLIFVPRAESHLQGVIILLEKKKVKMNKLFTHPKGKYKTILRLRDDSIALIKDFKKQKYDSKKIESMLELDIRPAIKLMNKAKSIVKESTKILDKIIKEFEGSLQIYKLQKREQRILGNKQFVKQAVQEVFDKSFEAFAKFPELEGQIQLLRKDVLKRIKLDTLISDSLDKASEVIGKIDEEHSVLSDVVKI